MQPIRVGFVINCPAPYRNAPLEILARNPALACKTFFCSKLEPIRNWRVDALKFDHQYLKERFYVSNDKVVHTNFDIWPALKKFKPDVVITSGFNPTFLFAYLYSRMHRVKHVAWTDGTAISETVLTVVHRAVRNHIYPRTAAFVGASNGSADLYRKYNTPPELFFKAPLAADNERFFAVGPVEKQYDFIFSGRFTEIKNPFFAIDVVKGVARKLGRTMSIAFIGAGSMEAQMREAAAVDGVDAHFLGFAQQDELPKRYAASRVLLFPTLWDPWGVVANEACAAGVPVLVTPVAGAANELVVNEKNGFVLPLEVDRWVDAASRLLTDSALYQRFSAESKRLVRDYTYENAAKGLLDAINAAAGRR